MESASDRGGARTVSVAAVAAGMGSGIMREEDLAQDAALARAFEHEKDAETHARAAGAVAGAGAGGAGSAGRKQAAKEAAAALLKPYRYVENYTLRGPKVWIDMGRECSVGGGFRFSGGSIFEAIRWMPCADMTHETGADTHAPH